MNQTELRDFLNEKVDQYNNPDFIESDPIQIPHLYNDPEDIAIAGFFTATIAWGQRKTIINNSKKWMDIMGNSPHDFILNASQQQLTRFSDFKHRTFNAEDANRFILSMRKLYLKHGSLEAVFASGIEATDKTMFNAIVHFRNEFLGEEKTRTHKHVSNPASGSAAKRINMFLRWMCRKDNKGVDFGIWDISPALLSCPLDVHSGNVGRKLGLLNRGQNDWKALTELDNALRKLDPKDPVKYDFALFGLGVFENF